MRQFVKRALAKLDQIDTKNSYNFITTASREIDRLETVIDSLPAGILVCDTAHKLVLANKTSRRLLSIISYEQAIETVWSVIPEQKIADFLYQTLTDSDRAQDREFDAMVNNMPRLLNVSVMPLVHDRQVTGSLILVDDITERRAREARMRRMENLASLTTLAAGVAHEIKNPLTALSLHVQLMQKIIHSEKTLYCQAHIDSEKYLKAMNEEVERLNGIVVDFLFAVRPMNAELRKGNINTLITELAEFVSLELKEANIRSVLNLEEKIPALYFDERLMKQALLNLIKNACAAMDGGGELGLATEGRDGRVHILVSDTGTGIPEDKLGKIFEPYFTTKETGTGLGLTMVFKIIQEHQGEINVKSCQGQGSVFTISLPAAHTEQRLIAYEGPVSGGTMP